MHKKISLFIVCLFFSFPVFSSAPLDEGAFLENVRLYAKNPENLLIISREDNITNGITCITDNEGAPYAVLKSEKRGSKREPFSYYYLKQFGLESTYAPSFYVDDLEVVSEDGTATYQGAVEQFVKIVDVPTLLDPDDENLDEDLKILIKWGKDRFGSLNLLKLYNEIRIDYKESQEEINEAKRVKNLLLETFNDYIDVESAHKYFAAFLLINPNDMTHRNLCFKTIYEEESGSYVLQPIGIDNETFFASRPRRLNAILNLRFHANLSTQQCAISSCHGMKRIFVLIQIKSQSLRFLIRTP
ncbi:MAG: hypothetical protein GY915_08430 [bacterium]|nr:hypothetical protein [bacterium]